VVGDDVLALVLVLLCDVNIQFSNVNDLCVCVLCFRVERELGSIL